MASTPPTRVARFAAGLLACGVVLAPLAGCSSDNVSCTTNSCSATLSGDGAEAKVFGTTLRFGGIQDGRASLGVGGATVSCAEGESVTAGPLRVTCSTVTQDSVKLTASLK
jgi:hypothetical protein